jgi:retron-type reverse transcriptase
MRYDDIWQWENLWLAYRKASTGKRGMAAAATFEYDLIENLHRLADQLREGTWEPGRYHSFFIHEPKRRLISAAPFRDRVVHHAFCNLVEPAFERSFIDHSYANRTGKGTHAARAQAQSYARRFRYVLPCDLQQFFPSVDHDVLIHTLRWKITDNRLLALAGRILESGQDVLANEYTMIWFPGDDLFARNRPRGLPIGNLTSQFWANCFLNPFDQFVTRELRCRGYVRYVDDFLLFGDDIIQLRDWRQAIEERLEKFRLTMHPGNHPRPVTEGIPYLGFVIDPVTIRLKSRKAVHMSRKLRRMTDEYHRGEIDIEAIDVTVAGWVNHVRFGNTVGLRKRVLDPVVLHPRQNVEARRKNVESS